MATKHFIHETLKNYMTGFGQMINLIVNFYEFALTLPGPSSGVIGSLTVTVA